MVYTRLSSKGQVVIPREIREALRLRKRQRFAVVIERDRVVLEPADGDDWASLKGSLKAKGGRLVADLEAEHRAERDREGGR
jgi:AbrB family looped-hinge helix DNA binding protein